MQLVSQLKYPCFFPDFQVHYIHTLTAKVLNKYFQTQKSHKSLKERLPYILDIYKWCTYT